MAVKKSLIFLLSFFIVFIYLIQSCKPGEEAAQPSAMVSATVQGRVTSNGRPVSDAAISTASGSTTKTDINGNFKLENVSLNKDAGFVKAKKIGYFTGSRTFMVNTEGSNTVSISLIPKAVRGTFEASAGGKAESYGNVSVQLQPNAVVNQSTGSAYTGKVSVSAFYIDPTTREGNTIMPGDLRGITADNQERGLKSFGMLAVELDGEKGEKLQLAKEKRAIITMPIPYSLIDKAPATIPLWYFDEEKGLWREEGSAVKKTDQFGSSYYEGQVGHFSFWSGDVAFQTINLKATLKNTADIPISNAQVVIKQVSTTFAGSELTDANGEVNGLVPANEELELIVLNNCGGNVFTKKLGAFSSDVNLDVITVESVIVPLAPIVITGKVIKCDGTPASNGYVEINHYSSAEGIQRTAIQSNGSFSFTLKNCPDWPFSSSITVGGISNSANVASVSVNVPKGSTNYDTGVLIDCNSTLQFTWDNKMYTLSEPADSVGYANYVQDIRNAMPEAIRGGFLALKAATYPDRFPNRLPVYIDFILENYVEKKGSYAIKTGNFEINGNPYVFVDGNLEVTDFGLPGGLMLGSWYGRVKPTDSFNEYIEINGMVKIRKIW